jgi:hypothetical protein
MGMTAGAGARTREYYTKPSISNLVRSAIRPYDGPCDEGPYLYVCVERRA